jgi:2-desacetyl-2-hydroxyethyl bacteriochlorophyllide A dehydrogenase
MSLLPAERQSLFFHGDRTVTVVNRPLPPPAPGEVMLRTLVSAISPGTELLFYRGQIPAGMAVDATIATLGGAIQWPLQYGYAAVVEVIGAGAGVDGAIRLGQHCFAFHPHESHFCARPETLIPLPPALAPVRAALLPSMETAVNFLMDGAPVIGERVALLGLGVVGLLTTALLSRFPLAKLRAVDPLPARRQWLQQLTGVTALHPDEAQAAAEDEELADLTYELTGNPAALNDAIVMTGFGGRIIIGSWYGVKEAPLALGGRFHRSRIRLLSSQVSSIDPHFGGRWTNRRRLTVALTELAALPVEQLITHRFPLAEAASAYQLLDNAPNQALQILLTYPTT